ncbi:hydantoinase/oxoprolinase family protein [Mycolicibacterium sp.]|uniref:hydantoinase/oxoprolinase family protein n=1 Tax=Mycolicibacterium sp. TaxID=2320850 RepID=UPI003D138F8F
MTADAHRTGGFRIGVDIGGTFTDMVVMDGTGIVAVGKVLTTPDEPARGVEQVITETLAEAGIDPRSVTSFVHGTTLITNALIERRGVRTALLTTAGFRDVLELRREHRYDLHDLMLELPEPLVPRWLRFDVPERIFADGSVHIPLDEAYVERLARELVQHGVQAVAVSFLHSYTNPAHERAARDVINRVAPSLHVALSSEVDPEIREFERTSTTVANVYVQQLAQTYLNDLRDRSARIGLPHAPHIMLSNGGVATVDVAGSFPIRMLESGPAGGALAAAAFGRAEGHDALLAFDMGGTTAKLCMVADAEPLVSHHFEVDRMYRMKPGSGLPVNIAVIDMIEIGVGGGSIARVNALGLLTVGPDSAGSDPGPVCYGRGGTAPTVTDADLVLGYLDPDYFLGGAMKLDFGAARAAIKTHIADPLGVTVEEAALGIHASVNEDMANAARVHAVERGSNPEGQPLFTSGGAGPVHGVGVARALGAPQLLCPPAAGVMGSVGFLTAPLSFDFVRSSHRSTDDLGPDAEVDAIFAEMEREGHDLLTGSGLAADAVTHRRFVEMRYQGQGFEVRVPVPGQSDDWPRTLLDAFREHYARLYRREGPDVAAEILSWRVVSSGPVPEVTLRERRTRDVAEPLTAKGRRDVYFAEAQRRLPANVYDRYHLRQQDTISGPAIVEERESTLVVPPGCEVTVATDGTLVVHIDPASGAAAKSSGDVAERYVS